MTKIRNQHGVEIDLNAAMELMDRDIMEEIDGLADTDEEYFRLYCKKHLEKFGEEFEADKENPVW